MANCINYNCADLPTYNDTLAACGAKVRGGGYSFIGVVECGTTISNPSSAAELNAKIAAGTLTIIANIKGGLDDPSAITADPVTSCSTAVTTNYTRTATVLDYKVDQTNTAFYNAARARSFGGFIIWECETEGLDPVVSYVDAEVALDAKRVMPNTNEQPQYYELKITWKSFNDPVQYDAPVGVTGVDA